MSREGHSFFVWVGKEMGEILFEWEGGRERSCAGGVGEGEGKDFVCGVEGDVVDFCEKRFGWDGVENGEKWWKVE